MNFFSLALSEKGTKPKQSTQCTIEVVSSILKCDISVFFVNAELISGRVYWVSGFQCCWTMWGAQVNGKASRWSCVPEKIKRVQADETGKIRRSSEATYMCNIPWSNWVETLFYFGFRIPRG